MSIVYKNPLLRVFPPPRFLTMPATGMDVSDEAIKFVELENTKQGMRLGTYGKVALGHGVIENGMIRKHEELIELLTSIKNDHNIHFVHASLPEEHSYLFQTEVPTGTPYDQARNVIEFKLKENVPLSPEEVVFDFVPVPHTTTRESKTVSVAVYPREILQAYSEVFQAAGITVLSFETEGAANARAIIPKGEQQTIMIVDIGKLATEISIVHNGIMSYTTTIEVCGNDFTHTIEKYKAITFEEAEIIKAEQGFVKDAENLDLFEVLLGTVSVLRDEINKNLAYWQMHSGGGKALQRDVEKIVLCGGGANLRGLTEYLTVTMDLPIENANVWVNVTSFDDYVPSMDRVQSLVFATAIGLAIRSVERVV